MSVTIRFSLVRGNETISIKMVQQTAKWHQVDDHTEIDIINSIVLVDECQYWK